MIEEDYGFGQMRRYLRGLRTVFRDSFFLMSVVDEQVGFFRDVRCILEEISDDDFNEILIGILSYIYHLEHRKRFVHCTNSWFEFDC